MRRTPDDFSVIELRLNAKDEGEGKTRSPAKLALDGAEDLAFGKLRFPARVFPDYENMAVRQ